MDGNIIALMTMNFAIYSYANVFFLLASFLAARGFSVESAGILVGAFYGATTLVRPVGSWMTEKLGVERSMVFSSLLCLGAALLLWLRQEPFIFLAFLRILMGVGFSVFVVALTTCQSLSLEESRRGLAFVMVSVGSLCPMLTVLPLSDLLIRTGHHRLYLFLPVAASLLCLLLVLRPRRDMEKAARRESLPLHWGTFRDLLRESPAVRMALSCFLFGLCDSAIVFVGSLFAERGLAASWFILPDAAGALLVRVLGRHIFNRLPRTSIAGPAFLLMAVSLLGISAAETKWPTAVLGFLYGLGMGFGYPAHLALTADLAAPPLRAKASALVHFFMDLSWFVLPLYMGFGSAMFGTARAFRLFALFCTGASLFVTAMWRQKMTEPA